MKIERVRLSPFRLALRTPVSTAREKIAARDGVLVEIEGEGAHGCGAATPIAGFGLEDAEACGAALRAIAQDLVSSPGCPLEKRIAALTARYADVPAARSAADAALHDFAARRAGVSLSSWLSGDIEPHDFVPVHALVSGGTVAELVAATLAAVAAGYTTLKLKVRAQSLEADLVRLAAVRGAAPDSIRIRLDANESWHDREEALRALERFARHEIELIEQPLGAAALSDAAWLCARSPVPLAADEAATDEAAVGRVIDAGAADVVVLKPAACGGIAAAGRIARQCRGAGLPIFVTSLLDSTVAIAAAAHFAASLGEPGPVCGLATGGLLADDVCQPLEVVEGCLQLPGRPGIGVEVDGSRLERLASGPVFERRA